jgi:hypothetical protein
MHVEGVRGVSGFIYLAAIINTVILLGIMVFQILLTLGFPLGAAAMGGKYKVFPKRLRVASAVSAVILLIMIVIFLQVGKLLSFSLPIPTVGIAWAFTIYLAINTCLNLLSKSQAEKRIMTPLSAVSCLLCLVIILSY